MIKPDVTRALDEIQALFPGSKFERHADGNGGAWFFVDPVDPGVRYASRALWMGADISAQYPYADIYPIFLSSTLQRVDGGPYGDAITTGHVFHGRQAIQVSRRSNRLDPKFDTAATKLIKVLEWLANR